MKTRICSAFALLVLLSACTIELSPSGPSDDVPTEDIGGDDVPGEDIGGGDEPASEVGTAIDWTEGADAPLARFEGQSAVVGGKLYIFGGYTDGSVIPKTFEADVYDPASDSWEQLPDTPRPMTHAGTVADDTNIYFAGGVVGSDDPDDAAKIPATTEVWRFDTVSEVWSVMPPLPEPRGAGALALLDDTLHFFGGTGEDRYQEVGDHWALALDGAEGWLELAPLPFPTNHLAGVTANGTIYAVGGQTGHNETLQTQSSVQAYDPEFDGWYEVAPLPQSLGHIGNATFEHGGRIYVVGGEVAYGGSSDQVFVYDPSLDLWEEATPFPSPEHSLLGGVVDGELVIGGGSALETRTLIGRLE